MRFMYSHVRWLYVNNRINQSIKHLEGAGFYVHCCLPKLHTLPSIVSLTRSFVSLFQVVVFVDNSFINIELYRVARICVNLLVCFA